MKRRRFLYGSALVGGIGVSGLAAALLTSPALAGHPGWHGRLGHGPGHGFCPGARSSSSRTSASASAAGAGTAGSEANERASTRASRAAAHRGGRPAIPSPVSARILIVDDDAELARMLAEYLRQAGFPCEHRADLRSARVTLAGPAPCAELVILDLMLPDGDGLEFCRQLRAGAIGTAAERQ